MSPTTSRARVEAYNWILEHSLPKVTWAAGTRTAMGRLLVFFFFAPNYFVFGSFGLDLDFSTFCT